MAFLALTRKNTDTHEELSPALFSSNHWSEEAGRSRCQLRFARTLADLKPFLPSLARYTAVIDSRSTSQRLSGHDVAAALERLRFERGLPQRIYCDNGSEFVSAVMDLWAYTHGVILDFSRRGKPTDNATIESFNGRFREEK